MHSSGDLTHALNYDPYGVPLQPNSATTLGFTGEQTDPNELVYLRARYYNPRLGTFTSVDPVLGVGGSTGWNGYLYANANPANLTDPSGRCVWEPGVDLISCGLENAGLLLGQVGSALGLMKQAADNASTYFHSDLEAAWANGLSGWWNGLLETLPHVWAFTFEVALPMFWEPADWISGIVNGDPLALLPLVPSAARFASHASDPLRIGRKVVEAVDTPHDLDSRGRVIVDRMTDESPGRSLAKRRTWYSDEPIKLPDSVSESLESTMKKYPPTSGQCSLCARNIYRTLNEAGYEARIGRLETAERFLTTRTGIQLSRRISNDLAYHEFVQVENTIFDSLTGPHGLTWIEYQNLFYEDVFSDGTIAVRYYIP